MTRPMVHSRNSGPNIHTMILFSSARLFFLRLNSPRKALPSVDGVSVSFRTCGSISIEARTPASSRDHGVVVVFRFQAIAQASHGDDLGATGFDFFAQGGSAERSVGKECVSTCRARG